MKNCPLRKRGSEKRYAFWIFLCRTGLPCHADAAKPHLDKNFFSSILGIPVAGATLPVLAFLLLAIYGKNIILGIAVVILGIGHIGIHLMHRREIET